MKIGYQLELPVKQAERPDHDQIHCHDVAQQPGDNQDQNASDQGNQRLERDSHHHVNPPFGDPSFFQGTAGPTISAGTKVVK
jgi:hypothetical protein